MRPRQGAVHGATPIGVLRAVPAGTVRRNARDEPARVIEHEGASRLLLRAVRWIFEREPERYAHHKGVVKRVLTGEAPANLIELTRK